MYIHMEQTLLKGAVELDVDQHINMLQTIYKDEFDYITTTYIIFKSKIEIQSNMLLIMKGLIRHMQELNPRKKALLTQVFQLA